MSRELEELEVKFAHMRKNLKEKKRLTRLSLEKILMEELALSKNEANAVVKFYFDEIMQGIEHNARVTIPPVGSFFQNYKASRKSINPFTREQIYVHQQRSLRFQGSTRLYHRMNTPEKYRDLYDRADEHTLILEDIEYNLDDPTFKTYDEGLAKGYTEEEIVEELLRQAKENEHYYTMDVDDEEE